MIEIWIEQEAITEGNKKSYFTFNDELDNTEAAAYLKSFIDIDRLSFVEEEMIEVWFYDMMLFRTLDYTNLDEIYFKMCEELKVRENCRIILENENSSDTNFTNDLNMQQGGVNDVKERQSTLSV